MTSPAGEDAQSPARDDEHALRLLISAWMKDGRITSAAFHTRSPGNARYVPVSLFLEERLPGEDGSSLHIDRFASHGRVRLQVAHIRSASRVIEGVERPLGFDLQVNGQADQPLEAFADAHANLTGPTHRPAAAKALAEAFNRDGSLEKEPG